MKNLILYSIQLYWILKTKKSKPKCIFKKSCSNYVYETTKEQGFFKGFEALKFRFKNCRNGYEVFKNPVTHETQILLPTKIIVGKNEIADRILN